MRASSRVASSLLGVLALFGCTELTKTDYLPPESSPAFRPSSGGSAPSFGSGGFGAGISAPDVGEVGGYGIDVTQGGQIISLPYGATRVLGNADGSCVLAGGYGLGLPGGGNGVVAALSVDRISPSGYVEMTAIAYTGENSSATFGSAVVDELGNVYAVGSYRGTLMLNGITLRSVYNPGAANPNDHADQHGKPSEDIFIFKLDRWGTLIWIWTIGGVGDQKASLVAREPDGTITLLGSFTGAFGFGEQVLVSSGGSTVSDLVFLRFSSDGVPLEARQMQSPDQPFTAMVSDSQGNLLLAGNRFDKPLEPVLGDYEQLKLKSDGAFVLKLDPELEPLWVTSLGEGLGPAVRDLEVDQEDNVIVVGNNPFSGDLFGEPLDERGIVVAKLSPEGEPIFGKAFGNTQSDHATSVTVLDDGSIAFTGSFYRDVDFEAGLLPSLEPGVADVFIARLDPEGNHLMSLRAGGIGSDYGMAIDTLPLGRLVTSGTFYTAIDFGSGIVLNRGGPYVAWLTP